MKGAMVGWLLLGVLFLFVLLFAHKAIKIFKDLGSN